MMKKITLIALSLLLTFTFTGCSNASPSNRAESMAQPVHNETVKENEAASLEESSVITEIVAGQVQTGVEGENDTKTAVVYFSATGTTAEVAQMIAKTTDADIFEIVPEESYTSEDLAYNDDNCRANKEMTDDAARPAIREDLSAVSEYDVIYLGYPVWWGTAPRIIQTFLENNDLSEATVYTFCTSGGSGIEKSVGDLKELYPDVNIVSGKRFTGAAENDVNTWIDSLE